MKAIVRTDYHEKEFGVKDGDVVEVLDNLNSQVDGAGIYNNPGMGMCSLCKDANGGLHYIAIRNLEVIDFTPTTDWQQVRIKASIAIVQGWASTPQGLTKICMKGAVELADALVKELKKGGVRNEND